MSNIGFSLMHGWPTQHTPRPISLLHCHVVDEFVVLDGWTSLPLTKPVTVSRYARGSTAARAGNDQQIGMFSDKFSQFLSAVNIDRQYPSSFSSDPCLLNQSLLYKQQHDQCPNQAKCGNCDEGTAECNSGRYIGHENRPRKRT